MTSRLRAFWKPTVDLRDASGVQLAGLRLDPPDAEGRKLNLRLAFTARYQLSQLTLVPGGSPYGHADVARVLGLVVDIGPAPRSAQNGVWSSC
jgi:hypothetical protein